MNVTDCPVCDLSPDERFQEVASILARGLLRLKSSTILPPATAVSGAETAQISGEKPLEFSSETRRRRICQAKTPIGLKDP